MKDLLVDYLSEGYAGLTTLVKDLLVDYLSEGFKAHLVCFS